MAETETKHSAEFICSEGNGTISRESGTLASGETVEDGQMLKLDTGKLYAAEGTFDSNGDSDETLVGFVIGNWDVSADTPVPYVARLAVLKESAVVLHTNSDSETIADSNAAIEAYLVTVDLILR